ncbi:MAG: prolyl oligopeptidase family serine peptidase [Phycisphaeraceae bacterium]|nr:prolyl oligopeptidase family serine peptidase [Phycisphaeraceae bacterium]
MRRFLRFMVGVTLSIGRPSAAQTPAEVFLVDGRRPDLAIVTLSEDVPARRAPASAMIAELTGVLDSLDRRGLEALASSASLPARLTDPALEGAHREIVIHLFARDEHSAVEVLRARDGRAAVRPVGAITTITPCVWLDPAKYADIAGGWRPFEGGYTSPSTPSQVVFELPRPYSQGPVFFDRSTLAGRLTTGTRLRVAPTTRDLDDESLWCRLPRGYSPRRPAGLVVWIDPTPDGTIRPSLHSALDELGMIAVSPRNAGNDRLMVDRMQLAMDAISTVSRRFHIDPDRIYIAGMSGGGRISSMLWGSCPDVFAGAVPVVGLNHYGQVLVDGRTLAAGFSRPRGDRWALLKTRRLGSISGPPDFNFEEIRLRTQSMANDGLPARLFSYEDMGHGMPAPEYFLEALAWVDEPRRERLSEEAAAGERLWAEFERTRTEIPAGTPLSRQDEESLIRITREAPWSEAAWRAVGLLGIRP